jgi:hypothetical protein
MWQAPISAQTYNPPRLSDGKPDLQGIWQSLNTAAWDLEDHNAEMGVPAGLSVVEGGTIPYLPGALAKRDENRKSKGKLDLTETKCYLPGVPRAVYMPWPFQILQTPKYVIIAYEFDHADRTVYVDGSKHPEGAIDFWMGDSRGSWDGNTLVIDVRNFNDQTWFDKAGNYHSEQLHVVERYTRTGPDHMLYEATIEDPKVFSRPWKISMPLYRRQEKNLQLLEYECTDFLQQQMSTTK